MTDDVEYNVRLIGLVEKQRVLYDHSYDGNSNRLTQEQAWKEVAQELGENMTTCREKWKNIRSCYTRHLRLKAIDKLKKPYYLSKHLEFLYPFCKILTPHTVTANPTSIKSQAESTKPNFTIIRKLETIDFEELQDDSNDVYENNESEIHSEHMYFQNINDPIAEDEINNSQKKEIKVQANNECINLTNSKEYKNQKRKIIDPAEEQPEEQIIKKNCLYNLNDDPDLIFFKSLLPDLHRMNNKQKIRLKLAVLKEINNILYADDSDNDPLRNTP